MVSAAAQKKLKGFDHRRSCGASEYSRHHGLKGRGPFFSLEKPDNAGMRLSVGLFPPSGAGRGENGHIISLGADDTLRGHAGS